MRKAITPTKINYTAEPPQNLSLTITLLCQELRKRVPRRKTVTAM